MKTTTGYTTTILTLALLLTTGSCVKDELHDTPHPDTGKITVTANWTQRSEGVDIPASWHIAMGDYNGTETGATHAPDYLFNPGNYTLAAYNTPEGITVSGTTATLAAADGGFIVNAPGWLFTSVQEVAIEADTDYSLYREHRGQSERSGRDAGFRHGHPRHALGGGAALHEDN